MYVIELIVLYLDSRRSSQMIPGYAELSRSKVLSGHMCEGDKQQCDLCGDDPSEPLVTCSAPGGWPLIGPHRSRDLNTGLWLVSCHQLVFWLAESPVTLCLHQDVTSSLPWSDAENFIVTHFASLLDVFGSVRNSRNDNVCGCDLLPLSLSTHNQMERSIKIWVLFHYYESGVYRSIVNF